MTDELGKKKGLDDTDKQKGQHYPTPETIGNVQLLSACGSTPGASEVSMATSAPLLSLGSVLPKSVFARENIGVSSIHCPKRSHVLKASIKKGLELNLVKRRDLATLLLGLPCLFVDSFDAKAAGLPPEEKPRICNDSCEKALENVPMVTTESGLQYKDIKVGQGPNPPVGYQVAANYVAMVPSGQIFDSSLEKGVPYIFRIGSGQVVKGLDEGILTMKVGGKRRIYIPGPLAFPKGLTSAPGRPRVAANSPVIFDVSLEYVPGLELDDE